MRKYIPYIFIILIVGGIFFGPFGAPIAEAKLSSCTPVLAWDTVGCIAELGNITLTGTSKILWITGILFDKTISLTLNNATFSNIDAINVGWRISRDVVNLAFIFILLYIAIATILRISGHGIKDLLKMVIIIALLVNFSLVATKVIIDFSNVLAMEFYNKIIVDESDNTRTISSVMMSGLSLSSIYDAENIGQAGVGEVASDGGISPWDVIFATIGGSFLMLVTSFVFLAAIILFIVRTVFLLFLMMLSPLAFVAMVLPGAKSIATKWWGHLFHQAFFAPAFMFMIYLVFAIINDPNFQKVVSLPGVDSGASFAAAFSGTNQDSIGIILNFALLIGLIIGSLIVAQSIGGKSAGMAIKWAHSARKLGQGYAGRISKRGAGWAAERASTTKDKETGERISGRLGRIPILNRGLAAISASGRKVNKARESKYKKGYENYSDASLSSLLTDPTIYGAKRKAAERVKQDRITKQAKKDAQDRLKGKENTEYNRIEEENKVIDNELKGVDSSIGGMMNRKAEKQKTLNDIELKIAALDNDDNEGLQKLQKEKQDLEERESKIEQNIMKREQNKAKQEKIDENRTKRGELDDLKGEIDKLKSKGGASEKTIESSSESKKT